MSSYQLLFILLVIISPGCSDFTGEQMSNRKMLKEIVDDLGRSQVEDGFSMPWSAVGRIVISGCPDVEYQKLCTGALIGPKTVITAAHCMYSTQGWCTNFQFQAGYTSGSNKFKAVEAVSVQIQECFKQDSVECDVGLLTLGEEIGYQTGFFQFNKDCGQLTIFNQISTAGYPLDKGGDEMYTSICEDVYVATCSKQKTFRHQCDTYEGMSGAPMWTKSIFQTNYVIRGINLGAYNYIPFNMGATMGNDLVNWIQQNV